MQETLSYTFPTEFLCHSEALNHRQPLVLLLCQQNPLHWLVEGNYNGTNPHIVLKSLDNPWNAGQAEERHVQNVAHNHARRIHGLVTENGRGHGNHLKTT